MSESTALKTLELIIFGDPVGYLAAHGIDATLVESNQTSIPEAA